jgi:hypothetical protein
MKRIINKLIKLHGSKNYIYINNAIKKHSHLSKIEEVYQVYMSNYVYKDGRVHFTPEFNTLKELEEYLKQNVEGYE